MRIPLSHRPNDYCCTHLNYAPVVIVVALIGILPLRFT